MHLKRHMMPRHWPLPRKGKKSQYVVVATHANHKGIPVLLILRDILKIASTRKEVKRMIYNKEVKVRGKIIHTDQYPLQVYGTLSLDKIKKHYILDIVNKKFSLREVSGKETAKKVVKVVGKKILSGKKMQMNLDDGQNFITHESFALGDSVVVSLADNKITKVLPLKEGAKIVVIAGKHAGKHGKIVGIKPLFRGKDYVVKLEDKEVELPLKTLLVVE